MCAAGLLVQPCASDAAAAAQVVSNKMMKSVTVAVTRLFRHTRLGKTMRETKKYMVRKSSSLATAEAPTLSALRLRRRHMTRRTRAGLVT